MGIIAPPPRCPDRYSLNFVVNRTYGERCRRVRPVAAGTVPEAVIGVDQKGVTNGLDHQIGPSGDEDDAATLIRSPETVDVIDKIAADHSIVLVDSPPVLPVSDSQALAATAVDHVLLVVRAGQSKRSEVTEALRRLEAAGRPATGLILTEAKSSASNSYKYSYSMND